MLRSLPVGGNPLFHFFSTDWQGVAADALVRGWLHEVRATEQLTLWLFTTAEGCGQELASLYGQRLHVETDIGDLKKTLKRDELRGRSVDKVEKELLAGVPAYNLTNQVRRLAAARLQIEPRRLSFAGVWSLLKAFLTSLRDGKTQTQAQKRCSSGCCVQRVSGNCRGVRQAETTRAK
jgi:hypothetical protein